MKKQLFFLVLIMSILCPSMAGYRVRGINTFVPPQNLKNFTLTIDNGGIPVSAGSMYTNDGIGTGLNTIVIISSDPLINPSFAFPIDFLTSGQNFNMLVRDFHYDVHNNKYLLCGAREIGASSRAFVAEIDGSLSIMTYVEYTEADVFYSICVPDIQMLDYYVAGKRGNYGVVASVNRSFLQFTNFYTTNIEWEYHKIIAKPGFNTPIPTLVVSGRSPGYTRIGFTTFDTSFGSRNSYMWAQNTEPRSQCVVCTELVGINNIVIASSYQNKITLNPVTFPVLPPAQIPSYQFTFITASGLLERYCVQDIGMINDIANLRISVAGFAIESSLTKTWHGYVLGLPGTSPMINNYFFGSTDELYQHYKIKCVYQRDYTGGYYENGMEMSALFGTPLQSAPNCDHPYTTPLPVYGLKDWSSFTLSSYQTMQHPYNHSLFFPVPMIYNYCDPFKGSDDAPEFSMTPPENESEITNSYDRIAVKDTPSGTNYQIYSVTGQLIQSGTTNPDISTAQLSRGMYILRLETGKAFKFVK